MKARRRPTFDSGSLIILIIIGVLAMIVITGHLQVILNWLYSPTAALILVTMLIEYLLLKGSDRSDIYKRELEAARLKRRDDLLALHDIEKQLIELQGKLTATLERPEDIQSLRDAVENTRQTTERLLARLRERI